MFDEDGYDDEDENWEQKDFLEGMEEAEGESKKKKKGPFAEDFDHLDDEMNKDFSK